MQISVTTTPQTLTSVDLVFESRKVVRVLSACAAQTCDAFLKSRVAAAHGEPDRIGVFNVPLLVAVLKVASQLPRTYTTQTIQAVLANQSQDLLAIFALHCSAVEFLAFWEKLEPDDKLKALRNKGPFTLGTPSFQGVDNLRECFGYELSIVEALTVAGSLKAAGVVADFANSQIEDTEILKFEWCKSPAPFRALARAICCGAEFSSELVAPLRRLTATIETHATAQTRDYFGGRYLDLLLGNPHIYKDNPGIGYLASLFLSSTGLAEEEKSESIRQVKEALQSAESYDAGYSKVWQVLLRLFKGQSPLDGWVSEEIEGYRRGYLGAKYQLDKQLFVESGKPSNGNCIYTHISTDPTLGARFIESSIQSITNPQYVLTTLRTNSPATSRRGMFVLLAASAILGTPLAARWSAVSTLARTYVPDGIDVTSWSRLIVNYPLAVHALPIAKLLPTWPKAPGSFSELTDGVRSLVGMTDDSVPAKVVGQLDQKLSFDLVRYYTVATSTDDLESVQTTSARMALQAALNLGLFGSGWSARHGHSAIGIAASSMDELRTQWHRLSTSAAASQMVNTRDYLTVRLPVTEGLERWLQESLVPFLGGIQEDKFTKAVAAFKALTPEIVASRDNNHWSTHSIQYTCSDRNPVIVRFDGDVLEVVVFLNAMTDSLFLGNR